MSVFDRLGELSRGETHAYLFYGPEGGSQFEAARRLCAAWMCSAPTEIGACGECADCASFGRGAHADFIEIAPMGATRQILQRQMQFDPTPREKKDQPNHRPLLDFARTPPLRARTKTTLIVSPEQLNNDAANMLLKTLEEPPPYFRFALVTDTVSRIRPTIRSRCLNIASAAIAPAVFQEKYGDQWTFAIAMPHLAERFLSKPEIREEFFRIVDELPLARRGHALRLSDSVRELAERAAPKDEPARESLASALEAIACAARIRWPQHSEFSGPFVDAHKRIMGAGQPALQLDRLFASLL